MSPWRVAVALLVLSSLAALVHRYLWARLVRDPAWPVGARRLLTRSLIGLAVLLPTTFLLMRSAPAWLSSPLAWVAYTWMGFVLYLFLLTLLGDGVRRLVARFSRSDPERRTALSRVLAAGVGVLSLLIGVGGIVQVARGFNVKRVRVPLRKLPVQASGFSIVQLTDVHVGPTLRREFVEEVVQSTNALEPDLVVITGDLVDGSVSQLREQVEPLRELRAKHGVFFVTGNHEYFYRADEWIEHLGTLGIRALRNEHVTIDGVFDLAGVDDASAARVQRGHGEDVPKAVAGRDPSRPLVLLAHQPRALQAALRAGVDLQISGHIHGGQLIPFNWLVRLQQPLVSGLHLVEATWVYVSMGAGYWGPPMRVGTEAEITRIELVSESAVV